MLAGALPESEMPCIPALLRIADRERFNDAAMTSIEAPASAIDLS